jgi:hypothetical protein
MTLEMNLIHLINIICRLSQSTYARTATVKTQRLNGTHSSTHNHSNLTASFRNAY